VNRGLRATFVICSVVAAAICAEQTARGDEGAAWPAFAAQERQAPADTAPAADEQFVPISACDDSSWLVGCNACEPVWTVRAGAVILDRSKPEDDTIARPLGGLLAVSAGGDFDFDWSGGVDVYLARHFANGLGVEARYFDVDSNASFDYDDTGDLEIGHTTVINLFDVDAAYDTSLHSTEINLRLPSSRRVTWLTGFRWLELHEQLNYDIDLLSLINNDFNWNTDNHMYGGQLGVDLRLWDLTSPLSINSVLKAGVYGNDADNHFRYKVANIPIVQGSQDRTDVAFVGDIAINFSYQLTRHVSLMAGYQLLWINGAALASDQAAYTLEQLDTNVLTTQGDLFYHGALTGVVVTW
jgi:hypothetical protein